MTGRVMPSVVDADCPVFIMLCWMSLCWVSWRRWCKLRSKNVLWYFHQSVAAVDISALPVEILVSMSWRFFSSSLLLETNKLKYLALSWPSLTFKSSAVACPSVVSFRHFHIGVGLLSHPKLTFVSNVAAYPSVSSLGASFHAPGLSTKYETRLEKLPGDKHT